MKCISSSTDSKWVACPDTMCSTRPQTSCSATAAACTWTTKARCRGREGWCIDIVGTSRLQEDSCLCLGEDYTGDIGLCLPPQTFEKPFGARWRRSISFGAERGSRAQPCHFLREGLLLSVERGYSQEMVNIRLTQPEKASTRVSPNTPVQACARHIEGPDSPRWSCRDHPDIRGWGGRAGHQASQDEEVSTPPEVLLSSSSFDTGAGCASGCVRAAGICQGRNGERSGGVMPPWAVQACKKALSQCRGLRAQRITVCRMLYIIRFSFRGDPSLQPRGGAKGWPRGQQSCKVAQNAIQYALWKPND